MTLPYGRRCKSINKLQVMQNAALRTATGCTQDINIQHLTKHLTKHSHFPYTSTYSSTIQTENTTSITSNTQTYNIHFNTPRLKKNTHYFQQRPLQNKHSHRPQHSHHNRHKNKHAPYRYIYCL